MRSLCSDWLAAVVLSVALIISTVQPQAQSGFILSVRIHRYINPTHRLGISKRCCDSRGFSDCENPCDNSFIFCLRPYGYPHQAIPSNCPYGRYYVPAFCLSFTANSNNTRMGSSQHGVDCDLLQFSDDADSFGNASNPLIFSGDSWPGGFQLITTVEDTDTSNEDDFVDGIIAEQWLDAGSSTGRMEIPGVYKLGFLQMSFHVTCNENFGGPNCTAYCGVEGCIPERAFCGGPGVCMCRDGYNGDDCTIGSSGGTTAAIAGGVAGGVVLVVLLLVVIIILVVVLCRRSRRTEGQAYLKPDSVSGEGFDPGDNPTYTGTVGTHAGYASEADSESSLYHKLDNPMYGAMESHEHVIAEARSPSGGSGVSSGHYSTISDGAPPTSPSQHYDYVEHNRYSNFHPIPTAVTSGSESELSDNNNHNEFGSTHYDRLLH